MVAQQVAVFAEHRDLRISGHGVPAQVQQLLLVLDATPKSSRWSFVPA
jgi:hypothetical protein